MLKPEILESRFCPLCGKKLESDGVSEQAKEGSREYHLCRGIAHEVPFVVCEIIESKTAQRSVYSHRADGNDITETSRLCFLCGSKMDFYCEYSGAYEGKSLITPVRLCRGECEQHMWQEVFGLRSILFIEWDTDDFIDLEEGFYTWNRSN